MSAWLWVPLLVFAAGVGIYANRASYAYLRRREPDRQRWQRLYPGEVPRVLATLEAIRDCFGLRADDVYRLEPGDRLYDIYSAAYRLHGIDALEFESLAQKLVDDLGVSEERASQQLGSATVEQVLLWTRSTQNT
jgi:hypothetical protein